jgi:hypothetical protein
MSDGSSHLDSEDIDLDEGGDGTVVSGAAAHVTTIERALKAGYTEVACGQHGTLVRDKKGQETVVLRRHAAEAAPGRRPR